MPNKITGTIGGAVLTGKITNAITIRGDVEHTYVNNKNELLKDVEKALSEVVDVPEVTG